ncbi:MAG: amidohydrolase [Bryobacteraceae bacterium]
MILLLLLSLPAFAADLIIHNAKVITVDGKFALAEAVAVTGNRITAVGSNRQILLQRTTTTKVIDAKGRSVIPGLVDAHVHAAGAGASEYKAKLPPLDSFAAVQAFLKAQAAKTPKGQWIIVPRTFPTRLAEMRMPTREVLDVLTEHPVGFDASYVWVVNSYALKISGIDRNTPNPAGGEIGHDVNGEPNGILRNANRLLKGLRSSDPLPRADKLAALKDQLNRYVDAGLTSVGDRAVGDEDIALYQELAHANQLPLRIVMTWRIDSSGPTEDVVSKIRNSPYKPGPAGSEMLRFGTFKVTLDGGMTIGTAYQRAPYGEFGKQLYGQSNPDSRGQLFIDPPKLLAIMTAALDRGWQLTAHSQGGGAIDALLDCFEALNARQPIAYTRSHLMHASFQSPEAIARLAKLGLPADVQPAWLYKDGPALKRVFPNNGLRYFIPLKSYRDRGVLLAGGSDHMIGHDKNNATNPYNPFLGMWTAVTRRMTNGEVLFPEERISRQEALQMYTLWAAHLQHAEKERGSIEAGKLADLVIIDRDYLTVPDDAIKDIQPVTVILNGKVVRGQ